VGIDFSLHWYDLADAACLGVLIVLALAGAWIYLDRRTPLANRVRILWRQPGPRALIFAAVSLSVLLTTAEAVLDHQEDEFLTDVDVVVRDAALAAAAWPGVRGAAQAVSDLTWTGLQGAVIVAGIALIYLRRWRETFVLLAGTLSAWALFRALKGLLGVPRPRFVAHHYVTITSYAFPSGHVLMTLVVTGLLLWAIGRLIGGPWTPGLDGRAILVAAVVGAARIMVDAHWLTDVIASLALGTLWLTAVVFVSNPRSGSHPPTRPPSDHPSTP
jgi:membrane-associated phospholipid phosphatase